MILILLIKNERAKRKSSKKLERTGDQEDQKKWFKITENLSSTEFLGYEQTESESEIISIIKNDYKTEKLLKMKMELLF